MAAAVEVADEKGLYITQLDEAVIAEVLALVEKEEASAHRWDETDSAGKRPSRSTLNYGWDFTQLENGVKRWRGVPAPVAKLQEQIFAAFGSLSADAAAGHLRKPSDLDNIIITIYGPGDSIVPHFDRAPNPAKSYYFGDSVFGTILLADESGDGIFWQKNEDHPGSSLTMEMVSPEIKPCEKPGLSFMMQSTIRNWPYYHGVIPPKKKRISVTARATIFKEDPPMRDWDPARDADKAEAAY
ncbi:hypothetical protein DIPPA_00689 [Diplonema papillatum]|nr:hypothetical protein DIPPA_00689 [Diplonema papillatum]